MRLVNRSAGRLPGDVVVTARRITDILGEVIARGESRPIDTFAAISVQGMIDDYLPTSMRGFLALDPSQLDVPQATGVTAVESLREQLDVLLDSAREVRAAVWRDDANALTAQGEFLRAKFSRSDLDL
ncbi:hypothetical protein [Micromonospora sp. NBC_00421]|uniref:hypothetical protein n=1 Tax=Micromonospora sp. NBC_00421 TaxID=2975976 RepID=UPI002E234E16